MPPVGGLIHFLLYTFFYRSAVLLLLFLLFALVATAQRTKSRFKISVVVVDSTSRQPLEAATVVLKEKNRSALTDALGKVAFDSVEAGYYTVQVSYIGYHVYERKVDVKQNRELRIDLCAEEFHLHEVEITERRAEEKSSVTGQHIEELNKKELDALRGQTLSDQLKLLPGVTTFSTGPSISKPVIRGLHSQRILTVNSGVRQEGQQWGGEHGPEIDPFMPGKVQVIKGASSVEYGPEAIGGVVRIEPREFRSAEGIGGELMGNYFSNNKQSAGSLVLDGHHHKGMQHVSWWMQGSLRKAGDSRTPEYVMSNTGFREYDGAASAEWRNTNSSVQVFYSRFATKLGILRGSHIGNKEDLLRAITAEEPFYTKPFTFHIGNPKQEVLHEIGSIKLMHNLKKIGRVSLQLAQQVNDRKEYDAHYIYSDSLRALQRPGYELTLTTQTAELKLEHKRLRNFTGKTGFSYMNQGNYASGERFLIPNFIARTAGVYVIEKWSKSRWQVEGGLRYDWRWMEVYQNINKLITQTPHAWQNLTVVLGGEYHISEYVKADMNMASAWRPPAVNELYSNGLHGGTATYETGNMNLKPEKSWNTDAGIQVTRQRWNLRAGVYSNYIGNFIYQQPDTQVTVTIRGSFPTWRYTQTNARLSGAELSGTYSPHKNWQFTGGITYLYAQNESANKPLILMPANRGNVRVSYLLPVLWKRVKESQLEWQTQIVDKQNRVPKGEDYMTPPDGYALHSFAWRTTFLAGKQEINFKIAAHNILNTSYRDYLSRFRYYTNEPGRNIVLSVQIPFTIYQPQNKK